MLEHIEITVHHTRLRSSSCSCNVTSELCRRGSRESASYKMKEASHHAYRLAELPQVPWATTEAITNEECLMKIGIVKARTQLLPQRRYSTISTGPPNIKQSKHTTLVLNQTAFTGVYVYLLTLLIKRHWETSVTGIRKSDSRCSNHATLSSTKAAADSNGQNSKCSLLRQDLNKV